MKTPPTRGTPELAAQLNEILNFVSAQPALWVGENKSQVINDVLLLYVLDMSYSREAICVAQNRLGKIVQDTKAYLLYKEAKRLLENEDVSASVAIRGFENYIIQTYGEQKKSSSESGERPESRATENRAQGQIFAQIRPQATETQLRFMGKSRQVTRKEIDELAEAAGFFIQAECGGFRVCRKQGAGVRDVFPSGGVCPTTTKRECLIFLRGYHAGLTAN